MTKSIETMPVEIMQFHTSREDYDVEPSIYKVQTSVGEIFTPKQIGILEILTRLAGNNPDSIDVYTSHSYREFRNPAYEASVVIRGRNEKEGPKTLVTKVSNDILDYNRWRKPTGWIEESDSAVAQTKTEELNSGPTLEEVVENIKQDDLRALRGDTRRAREFLGK